MHDYHCMSYSIHSAHENGMDLVVLKDEKTGTEAAILPEVGVLLHSFSVHTQTGVFNIIDNYNGLDQAKKEVDRSFKSVRLSPFPCRVSEGKYSYDGRTFQFKKNFLDGSAIHGLLYDKPFQMIGKKSDERTASAIFRYQYRKDDDAYPFDYTCDVKYSLTEGNSLELQTTITNDTNKPIPIADGWHPYFQLGGKIDECILSFKAESMVEFDEKLIPTGRLLPYHFFEKGKKINDVFLDNCFVIKTEMNRAACELTNPANNLKLSFFPDAAYPYLQIFTPPHRKSIAIENLSAAPDCFNNKMGLILLAPGHSQTFTVKYQISWK